VNVTSSGGAPESGDAHVVTETVDGALLAVVDGLGHGPAAAEAANAARGVIEDHAAEPPERILELCHDTLRSTRGAVATIVSLRFADDTLSWLGVGNAEAILRRAEPDGGRATEFAPLRPGIVGYRLPELRPAALTVRAGDLLMLTSDGIRTTPDEAIGPGEPVQAIADRILADRAAPDDDALVLVARYLGRSA
jgi:hypothetical protein